MAQTRTNTTLEEIQSISENMTKLQLQEWIHRQANELLMIKNMTMPTIKDNQRLKQENEKLKQEQFDELERLTKDMYMTLVDVEIFDNLIEKEQKYDELNREIEQLKQQKKEHGDSSYLQGYNHDRQEDAEYMWDFIRSQIDGDLKYHKKMFYEMFDENQYIIEGEKVVEVEDESDEE